MKTLNKRLLKFGKMKTTLDVEDLGAQPQVEGTPTTSASYATQEHDSVSNLTSVGNPPKK